MVRRGGMRTQMAKQMGVSKNKADDLLEKAKKMNDAEGFNKGGSSMAKKFPDLTGDGKTTYAEAPEFLKVEELLQVVEV